MEYIEFWLAALIGDCAPFTIIGVIVGALYWLDYINQRRRK